jgi:membrane-bound lytic murein transglycosylase MltF
LDATPPSGRDGTLSLIHATADRHQGNRALRQVGLDADDWQILFRALVEAESSYDPTAVSPKGAYGLGQLMPDVRRQGFWDRRRPELREGLAHLVVLIMRPICGEASAGFRWSFV